MLPIHTLLIAIVVAYRFTAAILESALYALPSIQRRLLLEEAFEGNQPSENSSEVNENPLSLALSLTIWNQTLLMLLLLLCWPFRNALPGSGWLLAVFLIVYIWAMDIVVPSLIVRANPATWAERLFPLYAPVHRLLSPLFAPLTARREKFQPDTEMENEDDEPTTEGVITAFLEEGEAEGIIKEEDSELIRNVVNLGDTVVREIMTPRNRMEGISSMATFDEVWEAFRSTRYARMPVYQNSIENIRGILLLKDLIQLKEQDPKDWSGLIKSAIFVPESKSTLELLRELQRARTQMAIVVDEYGDVAGLVTVEDLLEEVVGEIQDEHESSPLLHECSPGVYNVPGETHVDDLANLLGIELEHEGFDTVAGLVMSKLGRIPIPLETVRIQNLVLRVLKMEGQRVIMVEVRL